MRINMKYLVYLILLLFSMISYAAASKQKMTYSEEILGYIKSILHGELSIIDILHSFINFLMDVWNYKIFEFDAQPIAISNIVIGLALFIFAIKLSKHLSTKVRENILSKTTLDQTVQNSLEKIVNYIFIVITTLIVLEISHVPLKVFTFVGGAIAIGLGFGSQNILNNFISGLIIMVESPIKVGDVVEISGFIGKVMNIGARCIQMRTGNNIDILVPNSFVLQNIVTNWSLEDVRIKSSFNISTSIDNNASKVIEIIREALKENNDIKDQEPTVFLLSMENNEMKFEINIWVSLDYTKDKKQIISELNVRVKELFDQRNINMIISYPSYNGNG